MHRLSPIRALFGTLGLWLLTEVGLAGTWIQHTKAQFQTGTLSQVQATWPSGEDDGFLRLALPVVNGTFDEQDNPLEGWTDESEGDGTRVIEAVSAGGRPHVLHLYATYGTVTTRARVSQTFTHGLDFLRRFNVEVYPISSEIFHNGYIVFHVFAYDTNDNSLIQGGWIPYLLSGDWTPTTHDWRPQTVADRWNIYRFDLKDDIIERLQPGYTWSDVAKVKILFSVEATALGSSYGAYFDAVWAAPFIDDNFNDNAVDSTKWRVYENIYHVSEQGQQVRFWGYDASDTLYSSIDRERDTVQNASCEAAARMRPRYMENEEGQEFEIGFYSPVSGKLLILRAHQMPNNGGFYYVAAYDGISWSSSQIGTYTLLSSNKFYTWRILYDAPTQWFEAWVDGRMVGRIENFVMDTYYPYIAATDADNDPNDSLDCQVDDVMFFDFSQGAWNARNPENGEYITAPQDRGHPADFRRLRWAGTTPPGTEIKMQFRSGWTQAELEASPWYGPQGPNTFYTTPGQTIYPFHDGHRWFQVRVLFSTTDSTQTPTLDSLIVEYDSMAVIQADSGWASLGPGVTAVVHYDDMDRRSLVAVFSNPIALADEPASFMSSVHNTPPTGIIGGIERWWRLDFAGSFDSVALTFFYQNDDVPPGLGEETLGLWHRSSLSQPWSYLDPVGRDTAENWVRITGVMDLGDWTLGPSTATGVSEPSIPSLDAPHVRVTRQAMNIEFTLATKDRVRVILYDVTGRHIATLLDQQFRPGFHRITLQNPVRHQAGVFFLRIHVRGVTRFIKFVQFP